MKKYLLPHNAKFYKANIHAHSTVSDGALTPAELKKAYKERGYSILSITDHFKLADHSELSDKDFLMITGCELAVVESGDFEFKFKKCCHLNLYSEDPHKEQLFDYNADYTPKGINKIISDANKSGFIVCWNHPSWSMEEPGFYINYKGLFGMEIYNTLSDVNGIDEYNGHEYDAMLRNGSRLHCIAADDCHGNLPDNHPYCDMFGGFIMVAAPSLTYSSVFTALKNGDFYASTGPEIYELYIEDGIARLKCSEACDVKAITGTRRTGRCAASKGSYITEAEFAICPDNKYVRFEVTDKEGKKAYTGAYFL